MAELAWNQAGLAVASGVNPGTLSRFFNGKQELDVDQLTLVAHALGREPGDFLAKSAVDPMIERLSPIINELAPLLVEDQVRAVSALQISLVTMKNWRTEGSKMLTSVTTLGTPGTSSGDRKGPMTDEPIEPRTSR